MRLQISDAIKLKARIEKEDYPWSKRRALSFTLHLSQLYSCAAILRSEKSKEFLTEPTNCNGSDFNLHVVGRNCKGATIDYVENNKQGLIQ